MDFSASNSNYTSAILEESVKSKCRQTRPAVVGVSIVTVVMLVVSVVSESTRHNLNYLLIWAIPSLAALWARDVYAQKAVSKLSQSDLHRTNLHLIISSMVNQFIVGAGIWVAFIYLSVDMMFFVTGCIGLFGIGVMINLSSDFRAFCLSAPLMLIPVVIAWGLKAWEASGEFSGKYYAAVAVAVLVLFVLMIVAVKRSSTTFAESVTIRFEKNELLAVVEKEKQKVQEALESLQKANKSKAFFMAAASHDLRQPLYAISILTETLQLQKLPPNSEAIVQKQNMAISALRELFDNLLDLSKFEAKQVKPEIRETSVVALMAPLEIDVAEQCERKGLDWHVSYPEDSMVSDPELLSRLLRNLLTNAVRYTQSGYIKLLVTAEKNQLLFSLEDTGPGISVEDQRRVFDEFVQLENSHRNREQGVGMGLAIVKYINEALDLHLEMKSKIGQGTKFTFRVPCASVTLAPFGLTQPTTLNSIDLTNAEIWFVEDDPLVRDAMHHQLQIWGCKYQLFPNYSALRQYKGQNKEWPDALIIDDMLDEKLSGLEVARELEKQLPKEQIILVTGNANIDRQKTLATSGFEVLIKPIPVMELRTRFEKIINSKKVSANNGKITTIV